MDRKITLRRKLFSSDEKEVLETLNILTEKGYPEIVPDIIKLFMDNTSLKVKEQALFILNNLKDKTSVPYFIEGLQSSKKTKSNSSLISSCWQNGLDFSPYLSFFTKITALENIETAIEAYSVIESNISLLSDEELKNHKKEFEKICKMKDLKNKKLLDEIRKLFN